VALLLSSCAPLRHLNSAKSEFDQGARLENQGLFNPESEIADSPASRFEAAYAQVKKALENEAALRKDNLLAEAYKIKAYSEWKLKQYDEAEKSAGLALAEYQAMRGIGVEGDQALMKALPHFVAIEKAYHALGSLNQSGKAGFEAANEFHRKTIYDPGPNAAQLEGALQQINIIRSQLQGHNDVATYLVLSQLAGLKTWNDALDFLRQSIVGDAGLDSADKARAREALLNQLDSVYNPTRDELLTALKNLLPDDERSNKLVQYWSIRL
jgi:hypothetical protein